MKSTLILINPWIYDFAAYDLWSKPLGLLYLAGWFRERPREKAKWAQVKAQAQSEAQDKGGGQAKGQGAGVALEQAPPQLTQRQRELHGLTPYL